MAISGYLEEENGDYKLLPLSPVGKETKITNSAMATWRKKVIINLLNSLT